MKERLHFTNETKLTNYSKNENQKRMKIIDTNIQKCDIQQ